MSLPLEKNKPALQEVIARVADASKQDRAQGAVLAAVLPARYNKSSTLRPAADWTIQAPVQQLRHGHRLAAREWGPGGTRSFLFFHPAEGLARPPHPEETI
jgi:hypothetical protein